MSGVFTSEEIVEAGFEASQLKDTFTPADLSSNYTEEEIVSAGYSVAELADASFNAAALINNFTPEDNVSTVPSYTRHLYIYIINHERIAELKGKCLILRINF